MGRTRHNMDLDAAPRRADETLDDHRILIAFVLDEEGMLGFVDQTGDAVAAIAAAPDEVGMLAGVEVLAVPVGLETGDDFIDLVPVRSDDGVVTRFGEILRLPV